MVKSALPRSFFNIFHTDHTEKNILNVFFFNQQLMWVQLFLSTFNISCFYFTFISISGETYSATQTIIWPPETTGIAKAFLKHATYMTLFWFLCNDAHLTLSNLIFVSITVHPSSCWLTWCFVFEWLVTAARMVPTLINFLRTACLVIFWWETLCFLLPRGVWRDS